MAIKEGITLGNGEHKITLPNWLINGIVTMLLPIMANVVMFAYWAGKTTAQQEATVTQLNQLRDEVQKLRAQIDEMSKRTTKD